MQAHAKLWIDDKGQLCDTPPTRGMKIAAFSGDEIPNYIVQKYGLVVSGGKVTQGGRDAKSPKSTPDALIADRTLYVNSEGELVESAPAKGIKIADEGEVIPTYYVVEHFLTVKEGRIVQKGKTKKVEEPENKAVKETPNKGSGLTINKAKKGK